MKVWVVTDNGDPSKAFKSLKAANAYCRNNYDSEWPWILDVVCLAVEEGYTAPKARFKGEAFARFVDAPKTKKAA